MTDIYDEQKKRWFEQFVGTKILSGDWDNETKDTVKLHYDFDVLREFFDAGCDYAVQMIRSATSRG